MIEQKRRQHPRCMKDTAVNYHFLNHSTQNEAIARNYSRFGMYFETHRSLSPGTIIVIRNYGCKDPVDPDLAPAFCSQDHETSEACQELKTQVFGEVKRCEMLVGTTEERFGIAVRYIGPAT
jgi:hypothetical protein